MEVELEQRHHQLHYLLCVLHETLLQLFGIAHLVNKRNKTRSGNAETWSTSPNARSHLSSLIECKTKLSRVSV